MSLLCGRRLQAAFAAEVGLPVRARRDHEKRLSWTLAHEYGGLDGGGRPAVARLASAVRAGVLDVGGVGLVVAQPVDVVPVVRDGLTRVLCVASIAAELPDGRLVPLLPGRFPSFVLP